MDIRLVNCRRPPKRIYLRFGYWSSNEPSMNFHTGCYERGTSVYPAIANDGVVTIDWDHDMWDRCNPDMSALHGRFVWPVTGYEICKGHDGEPVLRSSSVVARPLAIGSFVYQEMTA